MCDNFRPSFENLWHLFSFRELKLSLGQQNGIAMTIETPSGPSYRVRILTSAKVFLVSGLTSRPHVSNGKCHRN